MESNTTEATAPAAAQTAPETAAPAAAPKTAPNCLLAIGNFDGVHLGHQHLLQTARQKAEELGLNLAILTFEPHPRAYFAQIAEKTAKNEGDIAQNPSKTTSNQPKAPLNAPKRLTTSEEKAILLAEYGQFHAHAFDATLAKMQPADFIEKILKATYRAAAVAVGENFAFGKNRAGRVDDLRAAFGADAVLALPLLHDETGTAYTSSRIRAALADNNIEEAEKLLGRAL